MEGRAAEAEASRPVLCLYCSSPAPPSRGEAGVQARAGPVLPGAAPVVSGNDAEPEDPAAVCIRNRGSDGRTPARVQRLFCPDRALGVHVSALHRTENPELVASLGDPSPRKSFAYAFHTVPGRGNVQPVSPGHRRGTFGIARGSGNRSPLRAGQIPNAGGFHLSELV